MNSKSTRRAFVLSGGAVLGAAGAAAATAGAAVANRKNIDVAAEREAIRRLHLTLLARVEEQDFTGAAELFAAPGAWQGAASMHAAYRQGVRQQMDAVVIGEDGAQADATFHVEAQVCTPIAGDCTAAQMARLQGNVASRHWESGRFAVKYAKTQGNWRIVSLSYERA